MINAAQKVTTVYGNDTHFLSASTFILTQVLILFTSISTARRVLLLFPFGHSNVQMSYRYNGIEVGFEPREPSSEVCVFNHCTMLPFIILSSIEEVTFLTNRFLSAHPSLNHGKP